MKCRRSKSGFGSRNGNPATPQIAALDAGYPQPASSEANTGRRRRAGMLGRTKRAAAHGATPARRLAGNMIAEGTPTGEKPGRPRRKAGVPAGGTGPASGPGPAWHSRSCRRAGGRDPPVAGDGARGIFRQMIVEHSQPAAPLWGQHHHVRQARPGPSNGCCPRAMRSIGRGPGRARHKMHNCLIFRSTSIELVNRCSLLRSKSIISQAGAAMLPNILKFSGDQDREAAVAGDRGSRQRNKGENGSGCAASSPALEISPSWLCGPGASVRQEFVTAARRMRSNGAAVSSPTRQSLRRDSRGRSRPQRTLRKQACSAAQAARRAFCYNGAHSGRPSGSAAREGEGKHGSARARQACRTREIPWATANVATNKQASKARQAEQAQGSPSRPVREIL